MLEPQNDEERKALRLRNASYSCTGHNASCGTAHLMEEENRNFWMAALAEARRIVREELGEGGKVDGPTRVSIDEWKAAEREIGAEKEALSERMIAANKAMLDEQCKHAENVAKVVQRWTLVPSNELEAVRAEIRLRSEVLRAFPDDIHPDSDGSKEISKQWKRFMWLLSRERELMAKSEPEGGDRG